MVMPMVTWVRILGIIGILAGLGLLGLGLYHLYFPYTLIIGPVLLVLGGFSEVYFYWLRNYSKERKTQQTSTSVQAQKS